MENPKYEIPQWALDIAVEGLQELARLKEIDAASLARMNTPESFALAEERLKQAKEFWKGHELFIQL